MTVFTCATQLAHLFSSMQADDSSVSLIALLAGVAGGWRLTGWHEQLKARRAKLQRETPRKPR